MNKSFLFLLIALSFGCKSFKGSTTSNPQSTAQKVVLTDEQQRRFDYFFYEANREKMLGNLERSANYYVECLKIDQNSAASLYELANIYLIDKQSDKAIGLLERAVFLSPENEWYSLLLAELYQSVGKNDKAIEAYKRTAEATNNEEYYFELALLYSKEKRYEEALSALNSIEKKIGINESVTLEKQRLYLEQGKSKEAIRELNALVKAYPFEYRYIGYLGDVYLFLRQFDQAETAYKSILEKDSSIELVYFSLSNLYLQKNDTSAFKSYLFKGMSSSNLDVDMKIQKLAPFVYSYKKEKALLSKSEIDSAFTIVFSINADDQRIYHIYGQFLKDEGELVKAYSVMKQGIIIDVTNESLWQDILFLDLELQNNKQLLSDSQEALTTCQSNPLFHILLSSAYLQQNKPQEALSTLKLGQPFIGDNAGFKGQFYAMYGDVYYKLKSVDSAFFYYDEALKINDKNLGVLNNYAYYLSLEGKDLGKAEQMSSKTVELDPTNSTYLDTYAWILFKRGRFFEAKFIIERALDNGGSTNGVIIEHYGDILFFNNDIEGAVTQWKRASLLETEDAELLKRKIESQKYFEN